jgi:hypothetical protein
VSFDDVAIVGSDPGVNLVALDDALDALARVDLAVSRTHR